MFDFFHFVIMHNPQCKLAMAHYFTANIQWFEWLSITLCCSSSSFSCYSHTYPIIVKGMGFFYAYKFFFKYVQCLETLLPGWTFTSLTVVRIMAIKNQTVYKDQSSKHVCNVTLDIA